MMKSFRSRAVAIILSGVMLLSACAKQEQPTPAAGSENLPQQSDAVNVVMEAPVSGQPKIITAAGNYMAGSKANVKPNMAMLNFPVSLAKSPMGDVAIVQNRGNCIFVTDWNLVEDLAVEGLAEPRFLLYGHESIYISDTGNGRILKLSEGKLTTLAEGLNKPSGMAQDESGNLFVADTLDHCILKIAPNGEVFVFAGQKGVSGYNDGENGDVLFNEPYDLALDSDGALIVSDSANSQLRKISYGRVSTIPTQDNPLDYPKGIDVADGVIYVADSNNHQVKAVTQSGSTITLAGTGVAGNVNDIPLKSDFNMPTDVMASDGFLYIADSFNNCVKKLEIDPQSISESNVTLPQPKSEAQSVGKAQTVTLFDMQGDVFVSKGGDSLEPAKKGMRMRQGETITTAEGGAAFLEIDDDKIIMLEQNTIITLSSVGNQKRNGATELSLLAGSVTNDIKRKQQSQFNIKTSNATMGARGTVFRVRITEDEQGANSPVVCVFEGSVAVDVQIPPSVMETLTEEEAVKVAALLSVQVDQAQQFGATEQSANELAEQAKQAQSDPGYTFEQSVTAAQVSQLPTEVLTFVADALITRSSQDAQTTQVLSEIKAELQAQGKGSDIVAKIDAIENAQKPADVEAPQDEAQEQTEMEAEQPTVREDQKPSATAAPAKPEERAEQEKPKPEEKPQAPEKTQTPAKPQPSQKPEKPAPLPTTAPNPTAAPIPTNAPPSWPEPSYEPFPTAPPTTPPTPPTESPTPIPTDEEKAVKAINDSNWDSTSISIVFAKHAEALGIHGDHISNIPIYATLFVKNAEVDFADISAVNAVLGSIKTGVNNSAFVILGTSSDKNTYFASLATAVTGRTAATIYMFKPSDDDQSFSLPSSADIQIKPLIEFGSNLSNYTISVSSLGMGASSQLALDGSITLMVKSGGKIDIGSRSVLIAPKLLGTDNTSTIANAGTFNGVSDVANFMWKPENGGSWEKVVLTADQVRAVNAAQNTVEMAAAIKDFTILGLVENNKADGVMQLAVYLYVFKPGSGYDADGIANAIASAKAADRFGAYATDPQVIAMMTVDTANGAKVSYATYAMALDSGCSDIYFFNGYYQAGTNFTVKAGQTLHVMTPMNLPNAASMIGINDTSKLVIEAGGSYANMNAGKYKWDSAWVIDTTT